MKLCYVLPKFDIDAGEHVYHKYGLLAELGKRCSLAILVEKCKGSPNFENAKEVICIKEQTLLPRCIETAGRMLELRLRGYDTFFVHYTFVGAVLASIIARFTGARVFYWNCGMPHLYFKPLGTGWLSSKLYDDWPLRLSLHLSNYLVTGTKRMKEYYHEQFDVPLKKIVVVPNQIDLSRFTPAKRKNKVPVVLFVHRISERKGAHHLVPIAKKVLETKKAQFVIIGEGPYLAELQASIRHNKLGRWVKTLGKIPNKDVAKYYQKADIFLMPSDEEGFPNVLLEAMATGTPFVASDVGGVRDVVCKTAQNFVAQKGNVDLFAEKLVQLLSDESMRAKLSREGLKHVRRYDVKKVAQIFLDVLKNN